MGIGRAYVFLCSFWPKMSLHFNAKAKNGGGICVTHGHSTEINAREIMGNLHVFQNVTIGTRGSTIGPVLGKNIIVGTGAVVLGDITIGDNVKIGANATVVKDLPECVTVVPAQCRMYDNK